MRRWLAHPWLMLGLLAAWLLLQESLAPGTIVVGIVLALVLARLFDVLRPPKVRVRHAGTLLVLLLVVCGDIVRSNIAVAGIILGRRRDLVSGFVVIPLQMTNAYGLATLACIITATPGTVWVSHDAARRELVIHVLDLVDAAGWVARIQQRYERPLREVFQ